MSERTSIDLANLISTRTMTSKVPAVTAAFWVTKVLTTGMGETTSDFFVTTIDPVIAVGVAGLVLVAILVIQLRMRRYIPWVYWATVVMVSIFGTMAADVVHVQFGVPYLVSTAAFVVALAAIFSWWYASERTLSIHNIHTRRREAFYWATVLATFALGTAAGDLTATTAQLGYLGSGILFAALICVPAIGYRFFGLNATVAFWFAYVVTRPLGASFADRFAVSRDRGGLDLGTGPVSLVLLIAIAGCVSYLSVRGSRQTKKPQTVEGLGLSLPDLDSNQEPAG
jgi:uncharacterized membrane-anchored protein